jgi:cob(I)alamin adenosyltransferase
MIHVYTGNGKGKTTAAIGLAVRALGAGKRVVLCQFLKGRQSSELAILNKLKNITVMRFGGRCFVRGKGSVSDCAMARLGLAQAAQVVSSKRYDMLILDEINVATQKKLVSCREVLALLRAVPKNKEIILTGRGAPLAIIKCADLVSEIKAVKHYYKKGLKCRKGIEW